MKLPFGKSALRRAIERGLMQGTLDDELEGVGEISLVTKGDAEDVLWGLRQFAKADGKGLAEHVKPLIRQLTKIGGKKAFVHVHEQGIPILLDLFDRITAEDEEYSGSTALLILKTGAMFLSLPAAMKVVEEAQRPYRPDEYLWSAVFKAFDEDHPHSDLVFGSFREKQPPDFAGVSLLDAANNILLKGGSINHPFDSDEGVRRLKEWFTSKKEDEASYARSATVALPFLSHGDRDLLLDLAMAHPNAEVRIEAAWVSARLGRESGFLRLVEYAGDLNMSRMAVNYLEELGRDDLVPAEAREPGFHARAEFANWLAHPCELGVPPDEVEVVDHRMLNWPPEREAKPFWLIKYRLKDRTGLAEDQVDCGLVGSVTFCLFSYELANRPPEDGYAIHCYWEMVCGKLIGETEVEEEPGDYESLLGQWTGGPLEEARLLRVAELDPSLRHPRQLVGVASARLEGINGWVVLDGDGSQWYPQSVMLEDTCDRDVLKIHVGRRLLGFATDIAREAKPVSPPVARRPEDVVAAYEKLLADEANSPKDEPYDNFGPLGKHLDAYVDALMAVGREEQIERVIHLLTPHWRQNAGYGQLGRVAFRRGLHDLAEQFFLKLRDGALLWHRGEEVGLLAEIWYARGEHDQAGDLLVACLEKLLEESKTAEDFDRGLFEKWYQMQRGPFLRLFQEEATALLDKYGLPETTLQAGHK